MRQKTARETRVQKGDLRLRQSRQDMVPNASMAALLYAGRIADEIVSHLTGLMGSTVKVTLEIEAEIPGGASDQVVRTVTENCRTLKFTSQGFESE
jgi:hypothetical protein